MSKKKEADIKKKMADEIIDLRLRLLLRAIGPGNCPHAFAPLKTKDDDHDCDDCNTCHKRYIRVKKKEIAEEVFTEYNIEQKQEA